MSCAAVSNPRLRERQPDLISGGGILGHGIHARPAGSHPSRRPRHLRVARRLTGIWQSRPRRFERRDGVPRSPGRSRRQRRRTAAHGGIFRQRRLGLWRHPPLLHRIERRRPRQIPPFRARVPPARHRRHSGRGLQPLRQRSGARPVAIRLDRSRTEHLLLVRGALLRLHVLRMAAISTTARPATRRAFGKRSSASSSSAARPS